MVPETLKIFVANNDFMIGFGCIGICIVTVLFLLVINRRHHQQQQQQRIDSNSQTATATNPVSSLSTLKSTKEKKKKAKKQTSGKKSSDSNEESTVSEDVSSSESPRSSATGERKSSRGHVDFAISTTDVLTVTAAAAASLKKRKQPPKTASSTVTSTAADKIKPILVNKSEKSEINLPIGDHVLNSFQEIVPKDDFELHRSRSLEKKTNSSRKDYVNRIKQMKSIGVQIESAASGVPAKKSSDLLQQLNKSQTLNVNLLIQLIQDSDITKFEIQTLIDMLLNKQQDTPDTNEDWSQGKSDPVQKLKKQLAEKQKQLDEEQEVNTSLTNKIRDIRTELNNEKLKMTKMLRENEDVMTKKKQEYRNLTNLCQNQVAKLQSQLNEAHEKQIVLQQEIKSYENVHADENKRSQSNLATINALTKEANDLKMELNAVREMDAQKQEMLHKQIALLENQLHHYRNEAEKIGELNKKLDDSIMIRADLEQRIAEILMSDREKSEALKQSNCELSFMKQIQEDSDKIITHLKNENVQLLEAEKLKSKEIVNLESFLMTLKKQLENAMMASNETDVLKNENGVLKTKLDELATSNQQILKSKTCEIEFLQKKLADMEKEFESRTKSNKNSDELKMSEIETLRNELDAKMDIVEGQRKQLANIKQELIELQKKMNEREKELTNHVTDLEDRLKKREQESNEKSETDRDLIESLETELNKVRANKMNGTETNGETEAIKENGSDSDMDSDKKYDQLQKKFDSINSFLSFTRTQLEIQAQKNVDLKKKNYKLFEMMAKRQHCDRCKTSEQDQKDVEESIKMLIAKLFPGAIQFLPVKESQQTFNDWLQSAELSLKKHLNISGNRISDKTVTTSATNGEHITTESSSSVNGENNTEDDEHN